ncbi:MAG: hypothetical protein ACTSQE_11690 [Candidatus Heimdallarchaeaceae archaeon]
MLITDSTGITLVSAGIFEDETRILLISGMIDALIGFSSSLEGAMIEKMSYGENNLIAIKSVSYSETEIHFILVIDQKEKDSDIQLRFSLAQALFEKYFTIKGTVEGVLIFPLNDSVTEEFSKVYTLKARKIKKLIEEIKNQG